jgi:hypothetical protein
VAQKEVYFPFVSADDSNKWLSIGSPFQVVCPQPSDLDPLLSVLSGDKYLLRLLNTSSDIGTTTTRVHLIFLEDATGEDLIRGMIHAYLVRRQTQAQENAVEFASEVDVITQSHEQVREQFPIMLQDMQARGWKTGTEFTTIENSTARRLTIELPVE